MAGICSAHISDIPAPDCPRCNATPYDLFPDWDRMVAEAEAAGKTKCLGCGFVFYLTTTNCPRCDLSL